MKVCVDTTILVDLFDAGALAMERQARRLLDVHTRAGETLLSRQVLQGCY